MNNHKKENIHLANNANGSNLLNTFRDYLRSPEARKEMVEADAAAATEEIRTHREALINKRRKLLADAAIRRAKVQSDERTAADTELKARRAYEDAVNAHQAVIDTLTTESTRLASQLAHIDYDLKQSADPAIAALAKELDALYESERKTPASNERRQSRTEFHRATGSPVEEIFSDAASRTRRLAAINAARRVCTEVIQFELHTRESLHDRLRQLRNSLPPVEIERVGTADQGLPAQAQVR